MKIAKVGSSSKTSSSLQTLGSLPLSTSGCPQNCQPLSPTRAGSSLQANNIGDRFSATLPLTIAASPRSARLTIISLLPSLDFQCPKALAHCHLNSLHL